MLYLKVGDSEYYDEGRNEFIPVGGKTLRFEHSLRSMAEWEAKYRVPFLSKNHEKTYEQIMDYITMMCLDQFEIKELTQSNVDELTDYISNEHSATTVLSNERPDSKVYTTEYIYAILVRAKVPFEVQDWNYSRLNKLLGVLGAMNEEPRKMSAQEIREQNRRLNEERKKQYNTKG